MTNSKQNRTSLDDETLTTPEHDKMILDLLDKEYILRLPINTLHNIISDKSIFMYNGNEKPLLVEYPNFNIVFPSSISSINRKTIEDVFINWDTQIAEFRDTDIEINILSESPILKGNSIIGYWDIVLNIKRPHMIITNPGYHDYHLYKTSADYWKTQIGNHTFCNTGDRYTKNSVDYLCSGGKEVYKSICIEVKPKISSFGATLRQLNKYAEYGRVPKNDIYLYTPDTTFKDAFENQGFKVITPLK